MLFPFATYLESCPLFRLEIMALSLTACKDARPAATVGEFVTVNSPGSGSRFFYINTWAMIWPTDYRDCDNHLEPQADTAPETEQVTDSGSE